MSRKRKNPDYNAEHMMKEFMEGVIDSFGEYDDRICQQVEEDHMSLNAVAEEFGITALKARKILITAGVYSTETSRRIQSFYAQNKSIPEIMELTNLGRASVHSYLPYSKIPYNMKELSVNAERSKLYRERKRKCAEFTNLVTKMSPAEQEDALWELLIFLQGCVFYTAKGLKFTYTVKGGELFVSRKEKSITRATIMMAFRKCQESGGVVSGPKKLGTFGASYLFPIFQRMGVVRKN